MGAPVHGTMAYARRHALHFSMRDDQGRPCRSSTTAPSRRTWTRHEPRRPRSPPRAPTTHAQQAFVADNLLVKCPSKYQGTPAAPSELRRRRHRTSVPAAMNSAVAQTPSVPADMQYGIPSSAAGDRSVATSLPALDCQEHTMPLFGTIASGPLWSPSPRSACTCSASAARRRGWPAG